MLMNSIVAIIDRLKALEQRLAFDQRGLQLKPARVRSISTETLQLRQRLWELRRERAMGGHWEGRP